MSIMGLTWGILILFGGVNAKNAAIMASSQPRSTSKTKNTKREKSGAIFPKYASDYQEVDQFSSAKFFFVWAKRNGEIDAAKELLPRKYLD